MPVSVGDACIHTHTLTYICLLPLDIYTHTHIYIYMYVDVRIGLKRKLSAEEWMLLNCGVGEDS